MRILIVGPGRAGGALGLASAKAGHEVVGLVARSPLRWDLPFPVLEGPCPTADLVIVATRDGDLAQAADGLVGRHPVGSAVHLSGATSVSVLAALAQRGWSTGSFHPLQTLPDPHTGAAALAGSWAAVTAAEELSSLLFDFARGLGMNPWPLEDEVKPAYHAGATAAAGLLLPPLDFARVMLGEAKVPFEAIGPLAHTMVTNAIALGPAEAVTGPLFRRDWETIRTHLKAATEVGMDRQFLLLLAAAADNGGIELPSDLDLAKDPDRA